LRVVLVGMQRLGRLHSFFRSNLIGVEWVNRDRPNPGLSLRKGRSQARPRIPLAQGPPDAMQARTLSTCREARTQRAFGIASKGPDSVVRRVGID
jgi:hypothetical protein